ncbi:tRNA pseudouridine(38-40) synthase TruA [Alkalitalea saponilacus]|uniref:tRNA pseudouridine synthase A n=1 Tax=Alkalitalea saponilacus TaxID=889453 RepID=A0A1T5HC92_9BACT|nr:tRNA pseudouridine(38-40) synthase TruA [Alkalitalea saponilacus]ASB50753.1 tRNA pseudouridine(38-40) synthase TruA [Alkalitalea saponilacus]SKC18325.1 tRNA pseudouridine38-40 synthase [Alkalitalea saponilacus]
MARYFIEMAYNGTNYHGWQRQPNGISVQEQLEKAISVILRESVSVTGAGRTDTGVHARYMVAHFDLQQELKEPQKLAIHLSRYLPNDIAIYSVVKVNDDAHSRFNAIARRYEYHITTEKNPFLNGLATRIKFQPNFDLMNEAALSLMEYDDFTSFSKLHGNAKTNLCRIDFAKWETHSNRYVFNIQADRFLRNMVRAIVGTLLDVGRGKITPDDFRKIIESKNRGKAGTSAPAEGLYLVDVIYPDKVFVKRGLN